MKVIRVCTENEVWDHWKKVENLQSIHQRGDIVDKLISYDMKWYLVEIEEMDLENIFIISSDDWRVLSNTFRLLDVVTEFDYDIKEGKMKGIPKKRLEKICDIKAKKQVYEENFDGLDKKLVIVSNQINGKYTIIEGNRRAVALQSMKKLVGNQFFLGVSKEIENYVWSRYAK